MWRRITLFLSAILALVTISAALPGTDEQIRSLLFDRQDRAGNSFPLMVDPPLWPNTRYLLEGESHVSLLSLLDNLLAQNIQQSIPDPRRRALLQYELWQVFDWTTQTDSNNGTARIELRKKLAAAIRRLALTKQEIDSLPSNLSPVGFEESPPDVLNTSEGWISLGFSDSTPVAPSHMKYFRGRSAFGVFLHHPGGPDAAVAYLQKLAKMPGLFFPVAYSGPDAVPQFPAGTKLALLRRMMLIDRDGEIVCSPIVQSVQVRTFLNVVDRASPESVRMQEFVLDRARYLAGEKDSLDAHGPEDREPLVFDSMGFDWFESDARNSPASYNPPQRVLESCITCHSQPGVFSINTAMKSLPPVLGDKSGLSNIDFPQQIGDTIRWKYSDSSWGMLRGYWEAGQN